MRIQTDRMLYLFAVADNQENFMGEKPTSFLGQYV